VHVIVSKQDKYVEVQVGTKMQHMWAEFVEKLADVDPDIKYGGGDAELRGGLLRLSDTVYDVEVALAESAVQRFQQVDDRNHALARLRDVSARAREAAGWLQALAETLKRRM